MWVVEGELGDEEAEEASHALGLDVSARRQVAEAFVEQARRKRLVLAHLQQSVPNEPDAPVGSVAGAIHRPLQLRKLRGKERHLLIQQKFDLHLDVDALWQLVVTLEQEI